MASRKIEPEQRAWSEYVRTHPELTRFSIQAAHDAFKAGWHQAAVADLLVCTKGRMLAVHDRPCEPGCNYPPLKEERDAR